MACDGQIRIPPSALFWPDLSSDLEHLIGAFNNETNFETNSVRLHATERLALNESTVHPGMHRQPAAWDGRLGVQLALREAPRLHFDASVQIHISECVRGRRALASDAGYGATLDGLAPAWQWSAHTC